MRTASPQQVGLQELDPIADELEVLVSLRWMAPDDAEDLVAVLQQELGEERPVLPADARDQRPPHGRKSMLRRRYG